jgi:hypothetical protein
MFLFSSISFINYVLGYVTSIEIKTVNEAKIHNKISSIIMVISLMGIVWLFN